MVDVAQAGNRIVFNRGGVPAVAQLNDKTFDRTYYALFDNGDSQQIFDKLTGASAMGFYHRKALNLDGLKLPPKSVVLRRPLDLGSLYSRLKYGETIVHEIAHSRGADELAARREARRFLQRNGLTGPSDIQILYYMSALYHYEDRYSSAVRQVFGSGISGKIQSWVFRTKAWLRNFFEVETGLYSLEEDIQNMLNTQKNGSRTAKVAESQDRALLNISGSTRQSLVGTDPEYVKQGGWKVHLSVPEENYNSNVALIKQWLQNFFGGTWKHADGGEKHECDFTVYLGSRATLNRFVEVFEGSSAIHWVGESKAGSTDCIVGVTGKVSARFDTKATDHEKGRFDHYGRGGIPIAQEYEDLWPPWNDPNTRTQAVELSRQLLEKRFGTYFTG